MKSWIIQMEDAENGDGIITFPPDFVKYMEDQGYDLSEGSTITYKITESGVEMNFTEKKKLHPLAINWLKSHLPEKHGHYTFYSNGVSADERDIVENLIGFFIDNEKELSEIEEMLNFNSDDSP